MMMNGRCCFGLVMLARQWLGTNCVVKGLFMSSRCRSGFCGMLYSLVAVLACGLSTSAVRAQGDAAAAVSVAQVRQQSASSLQSFVGTVQPDRTNVIGTSVEGRVTELLVREGDFIKSDEPIARLRTGTIEIELARAKAESRLAAARLAELKAGTRPQVIEEAAAKVRSAESRLKFSEERLARIEALFARKTSSVDDRDEARLACDEARSMLDVAKTAYSLAVEGPRPEEVLAAEARFAADEETVRLLEDRLEKFTIRAYFDGYVTERKTEVGYWLKAGDPVVSMVDLQSVDVRVLVAEDYIEHIEVGQQISAKINALKDGVFAGSIARVVPLADNRSRSFPVHVRIPNSMGRFGPVLKAGMMAQVMLPTGSATIAKQVPKDALVLGGAQPVVYVVDLEPGKKLQGTARVVPVESHQAAGDWIEVTGEIQAGQLVVVLGNERLRPGQPVEIISERPPEVAPAGTPAAIRPASAMPRAEEAEKTKRTGSSRAAGPAADGG